MPSSRRQRRTLSFAAALATLALTQAGCPVWQDQDTPVEAFGCSEPTLGAVYRMYVPSDYEPSRPWPLVVTLHGTHGFDSAKAQVREWKALAEEKGFIVIAPELSSSQGILPVVRSLRLKALQTDEARVSACLADAKRRYRIDERTVMITGFSAGGYPLYYIGLRNPQQFTTLVARSCNCDMEIVKSIPISDQTRKMAMLIFFSKTGINPISSSLNPIARQSWAVFRYLRENKCFKVKIDAVSGGHHRRPDVAFRFWSEHWPKTP